MKRWQTALLSIGTLALGLGLGLSWRSQPAPSSVLGKVQAPRHRDETQRELAVLRRQLKIVTGRVQALEAEVYGRPVSWSESGMDTLSQQAFRDGLERAAQRCRAGWEILEMDCSEPPCVSLLRGDPLQADAVKASVLECDAWGAATPVVSSEVVDCADGEPVAYHLLWFGDVPEGAFYHNLRLRLQARIVDLLQSNACRTP